MAEHARIIDAGRGHYVTANHPANATDVAVPVDEYDALIRARDILANPEQLADDLDHVTAHVVAVNGVSPWEQHAVIRTRDLADRLRRAAAGTADPDA